MDVTSAVLFNRVSLYTDVDFYKKDSGLTSYGFQAGLDMTHQFGLVKVPEGFPIRNAYFALRASSSSKNFPVNIYLAYVNTKSLDNSTLDLSGNFIKMGFDINKYFWENKFGLKFKLDLPFYTISGSNNGFYTGFGIVFGILNY